MPIFRIADGKLQRLTPNLVGKEKDLQNLVENNLLEVLDTHFLETEYATTSGGRIDTLGVDRNGAPTIIEYKRNQNDNVINQGLSYLRWLKTQKPGFFEMLIRKRLPKEVADDIKLDWKTPRLICIAESFSRFDIDTVEMVPIRIELMTYRFYENSVFSLTLESSLVGQHLQERSVKPEAHDGNKDAGSIESHRARASAETKALFDDVRARIIALGPQVTERATGSYIAYRASKNFVELHVQKSQLKIYLRPIEYDDPEHRVRKVDESFRWTMDREVLVRNVHELQYVMPLIEQSYNDVI